MTGWVRAARRFAAMPFRLLRGRDLALHAAAVTFYGGIAVVPVALLAIWLTGLVAGAARVRRLTAYTVDALPTAIGADRALAALIDAGLQLTPVFALASLLPASLYGEGLRRAFVYLRDPGEPLVGWRGRIRVLPLLAAAPALLLSLLMALPTASRLWVRGGWWSVAGVVLSFLAAWLVLTPVLIWVYRAVAPAGRSGSRRCWWGRSPPRTFPASCTGSCCSAHCRWISACRSGGSPESARWWRSRCGCTCST